MEARLLSSESGEDMCQCGSGCGPVTPRLREVIANLICQCCGQKPKQLVALSLKKDSDQGLLEVEDFRAYFGKKRGTTPMLWPTSQSPAELVSKQCD